MADVQSKAKRVQLLDLPVEILENVIWQTRWTDLRVNLCLVNRQLANLAKARLFYYVEFAHGTLALRQTSPEERYAARINELSSETFALYRRAKVTFRFAHESVSTAQARLRWWTSLLQLMPGLRDVDIEVLVGYTAMPQEASRNLNIVFNDLLRVLRRRSPSLSVSSLRYLGDLPCNTHVWTGHLLPEQTGSIIDLLVSLDVKSLMLSCFSIDKPTLYRHVIQNVSSMSALTRLDLPHPPFATAGEDSRPFPNLTSLSMRMPRPAMSADMGFELLHKFLERCPALNHLQVNEIQTLPLVPTAYHLSMPSLRSISFDGPSAGIFLDTLQAVNLRRLHVTCEDFQPHGILPSLAPGRFPSLSELRCGGDFSWQGALDAIWHVAYRDMALSAEHLGLDLQLELKLSPDDEHWLPGSPEMMGLLEATSPHLAECVTSDLAPIGYPSKSEGIHFPKLRSLIIKFGSPYDGAAPSLHWLVQWLQACHAPRLEELILCSYDVPDHGSILEIAYLVGIGALFPTLESISIIISMSGKLPGFNALHASGDLQEHLSAIEAQLKEALGTRIRIGELSVGY